MSAQEIDNLNKQCVALKHMPQQYVLNLLNGVKVEWKSVSDIFHLKNGYTPSTLNSEFWESGTVPWFRMDDIRENGQILNDSLQKISSSAVKEPSSKKWLTRSCAVILK